MHSILLVFILYLQAAAGGVPIEATGAWSAQCTAWTVNAAQEYVTTSYRHTDGVDAMAIVLPSDMTLLHCVLYVPDSRQYVDTLPARVPIGNVSKATSIILRQIEPQHMEYLAMFDLATRRPLLAPGLECDGYDGYVDSSIPARVYDSDNQTIVSLPHGWDYAIMCRQHIAGETIWYEPAWIEDHDGAQDPKRPASIYLRQVAVNHIILEDSMPYRGNVLIDVAWYTGDDMLPVTVTVFLTWRAGCGYHVDLPLGWELLGCAQRVHTQYLPTVLRVW